MVPRAPTETPAAKAATALESAKEADSGGALPAIPEQREQSAPMPPPETLQAGASGADDAPLDLKKDEFAPAGNAQNPHEKTYAAIRALRESGELLQAKAMLARFKKAYPNVVLPNDLKALAKEI